MKTGLIKALALGAVELGLSHEDLNEGLKAIEADRDHRFKLVTDAIFSLEEQGHEMKQELPSLTPTPGWEVQHEKVDQYWKAYRMLLVWWNAVR